MGKVNLVNIHESSEEVPYMMVDGKKSFFTTQDEVFLNSQCLFVEYTDIIKSPYFIFLHSLILYPNQFSEYLDIDRLRGYDLESLSEWYINRKYQNPLMDLLKDKYKDTIFPYKLDELFNNIINNYPNLITLSPLLNFSSVIKGLNINKNSIVKKIVIWNLYPNDIIRKDIRENFGDNIHFVTGELYDVLKNVPDDSTYVFSDISNISVLLDSNKLNLSSVLVPKEYKYNYIDNNILKIDYNAYLKEALFKFNLFNASFNYNDDSID